MNSRWQANKIGLINFWYYDEQEFPFVKGRMLLRGANGSGKSVTMQSVIPLLLDGNMSPERLDPFGSKDRKMSSYLLEEDDKREERTGYLYLEFKREESDTYLTIGMGIRARKGKPLDKWYFSLTDGRRIGQDFFLYKETDEKVTLSRKELEFRIQSGGQVFDRQSDYMEYVNRQIFGFETVDEYKEMIDLLIQLRTPKLSKDFKPSVINDILSDSLQPLSDEELRPLSEAIENMDTMSMNLKSRKEALQASEKIRKVLDKYNRIVLFEKAEQYEECQDRLLSLKKEAAEREKTLKEYESRVNELEQQKVVLDAEKDAKEKEKESLNKSDAVALRTRELELEKEIADKELRVKEKEQQLSAKTEQYLETEGKKKEEEDREYRKEKELSELLEEMQTAADEMCFEEHAFFAGELTEKFKEPYAFDTHQMQFEKTRLGIKEGITILREMELLQRQADELIQKKEKHQREADAAQRRVSELGTMFVQIQNEWKEAVYSWNGKNQELVLAGEPLKELAAYAETYGESSDYGKIREMVANAWIQNKNILKTEADGKQRELRELQTEHEEQKRQLEEWENHREPEPERSEAVLKNREHLRELQIPYQEFYKVLEFGGELDKKACDRLEEALLSMGILDALVIEEQYRDQVLSMEKDGADRYLFVQNQHVSKSILEVLELNDAVNDIFFNQRITNILGNIAYDGVGTTAISPDGTYQLGVLTGTVTGTYEAGFLGSRAREKNRQSKIAACRERIAALEKNMEELRESLAVCESRIAQLQKEYESFPKDADLREAYVMLKEAERVVERMQEERLRLEQQLQEMLQQLQERKKEALKLSEKLYLPCSYEAFQRAEEAAGVYGEYLARLKEGHELYRQIVSHLAELEERLADLDADMEQIRYEKGNVQQSLRKNQEEYRSVHEQLQLTDYEEIKERLENCVKWLNAYPTLLEKCVNECAQKKVQMDHLRDAQKDGAEQIERNTMKSQYLEKCYEAELDLCYVELPAEISENAGKVRRYLAVDQKGAQKESIVNDLNKVYWENRGMLGDYQLMQTNLFEELEMPEQKGNLSVKRLDIVARYQGTKIPFHKLTGYLEEEIEELETLIRDGDRELFEDILANTVSRKIRAKINSSNAWVDKMNALMGLMNTSSSLKLCLRWRSKTAETEEQLDTKELVELLKKDYRLMREEEAEKLSLHFRSKVKEARRRAQDGGGMVSFYQVMKETLDYRKWFEFQIFAQKNGERQKELTNSVFGTYSGGEKAMSMYVPLFSAVVAKYQGGRADAPRLISLDEAFAGVDNRNIREMFQLMRECEFNFIINSQVLWGDCDTLDALAIYQLLRPENAKYVTVMSYLWNGKTKVMLEDEKELERRATERAE